mmetsp:Transcript_32486/g.103941  ORF Transcript_32486/g.103941 Transcript_32486/m.103941 type:complete len:317 (+) Transcript_32486:13-963(+)
MAQLLRRLSLPSLRCRVGAAALGRAGPSSLFSLRPLSSAVPLAPPPLAHAPPTELGPLALNRIRDNYGARLKKTRVGRGVGSGRGRKSGRGMKGMAARAGNKGFLLQSGGQTSDVKRIPKRGFYRLKREYLGVNLQDLQSWVLSGRLDRPAADAPITVKTLFDNRLITLRAGVSGIKLLGRGGGQLQVPLHVEAQQLSAPAIQAVEAAGGSVTAVYYSPLALRGLLKPEAFERKGRLRPRPALPPPKLMLKYMDAERRGYLADLKPGDVVRPHEHPPHVDLSARNPRSALPLGRRRSDWEAERSGGGSGGGGGGGG